MRKARAIPKNQYLGYLLILPTYLLFITFFFIPLVYSFLLTFVKWNGFSPNREFVALNNYIRLFSDTGFLNALTNSMVYLVATVILSISISLLLSVLINEGIKGSSLINAIYFLPHIVSLVAVSVVWSWVYLPSGSGLINSFLGVFGITPKLWLKDPNLSMLSIIIIGVWKSLGYNIVILTAGLMSISPSLYEAANIDGANKVQTFFKVTLPLLKPTLFFVSVTGTTAGLIQVFDVVNVTTGGGPIGSTEMLVTYLYKLGFKEYEIGYASAVAFALFFISLLITSIQKKFADAKED